MDNKQRIIESIEPHTLQVPTMDRPSLAFAWFLDRMEVVWSESSGGPVLTCNYCGAGICDVEHGDTLRVLLNTTLAHTCEVK